MMYLLSVTKLIHMVPISAYYEKAQSIKLYMREFCGLTGIFPVLNNKP